MNHIGQLTLLTITIGLPKSSTQFCRVRQNHRSKWKQRSFFCCGKCSFGLTGLLWTQNNTDCNCTRTTLQKQHCGEVRGTMTCFLLKVTVALNLSNLSISLWHNPAAHLPKKKLRQERKGCLLLLQKCTETKEKLNISEKSISLLSALCIITIKMSALVHLDWQRNLNLNCIQFALAWLAVTSQANKYRSIQVLQPCLAANKLHSLNSLLIATDRQRLSHPQMSSFKLTGNEEETWLESRERIGIFFFFLHYKGGFLREQSFSV